MLQQYYFQLFGDPSTPNQMHKIILPLNVETAPNDCKVNKLIYASYQVFTLSSTETVAFACMQ